MIFTSKSGIYNNSFCLMGYHARDLKDKLDEYNLTNITRSMTRYKRLPFFGEDKTFVEFEPKILEKINNFHIKNLSHIMYCYAVREQGNPEFHKKVLKRLVDEDKPLDYQTLNNILYYLMINNNKDEKLWTRLVTNTLENEGYIPIRQYAPFKLSKFYLKHHFPKMDIRDYVDKFFYPERYYNAILDQNLLLSSSLKMEFSNFLYLHLHLVPVHYITLHNLFTLRHWFMDQKIAINYYIEEELLPNEKRISGKHKLYSKLLSYEGWEILDTTAIEHDKMNLQEKINFYRGWIIAAKNKQIDKGILPKVEPQYV